MGHPQQSLWPLASSPCIYRRAERLSVKRHPPNMPMLRWRRSLPLDERRWPRRLVLHSLRRQNQQGGGGSGIDLLMRLRGWNFREAIQRIESYYYGLPFQPAVKQATPLPKPSTANYKHSELERFLLLELACQLSDDESFSPAQARERTYSKRWAVYSSSNHDLACSIILQFETERGIVEPPQELANLSHV